MRRRVYWMTGLDESILEFYEELGGDPPIALPPTAVWWNLVEDRGVSESVQSTFSRRMTKLTDAGLLDQVDEKRGYYKITDLGIRYLEEDLTDEEHQHLREQFD